MTKQSTQMQRGKSADQRFEEKYEEIEGCWLWKSAFGTRGYGIFWHGKDRKSIFAHRYALERKVGGLLPDGMVAMHSCDNPACVNPEHLSLGTNRDNAMDAKAKGRLAFGERNGGGRKLTEEQVRGIRARSGKTSGPQEAAKHGVSRYVVNAIRRNQIWRHVHVAVSD